MSPFIIILFLISNIIFTLAVERFMGVFFEKRRTPLPVLVLSYLLYFTMANLERLMFNSFLAHIIFTLPVLLIITLNYESPMPKRLVAAAANYVLFSIVTSIMAYNLLLLPAQIYDIVNDNLIGQYLSASLVSYVGIFLFRRFEKIKQNNFSMPLFWGYALVISISIEVVMYFSTTDAKWLVDVFATVLFLGVLFLIFYVYDSFSSAYEEKLKTALYSQEKEYYLAQCRLMQESVEKMKSFRHDTKNHFAILKDYSAGNKIATDYLNSLLGDIGESEVYSDTGNIVFDSIINYKLKNAAEDNIKLDIQLFVPQALGVEVVDIVTILGNLLDNALDAVAKVAYRMIKLNVEYRKSNLFIMIENTYDGIIEYADGSRTEYAHDRRTKFALDRRNKYVLDRRNKYVLDRRAIYADGSSVIYTDRSRAIYADGRRALYADGRRAIYTNGRRAVYADGSRSVFPDSNRAIYADGSRTGYVNDRRTGFVHDRRTEHVYDRRTAYANDRRAIYTHVRRTEYADGRAGEEKRIVSRKSGDDHGQGLKNIRRSVEKYNGHIVITYDENIFSVGILLYAHDN